ncbi:unnamed protein product [Closterium sp. NIES-65]|nr:unnamed protein product [Closterium sp. NIES-65]CAI5988571.1 unnamed protein product [Closterium sp. NIES-65]
MGRLEIVLALLGSLLATLLVALLVGAFAKEQEQDFLPGQPGERVRGSGGSVEVWNEDFKQLQEAHVAAALITVQSQFLELPLYANSPQAYYVLKGEAMAGLISPMGAPTNLRRLREGDAFAIPRGWARWIWNNGQQPFQVLSVADTSHAANTSKGAPSAAGRYTAFHLMGAHKENFGSILHGFSHDLLAQAWDVEEGEVQQLLQAQQESVFVKVTPQLRAELENYGKEDEEENENEKETENGNGNENGNEAEEEAEEAEENEWEEEEAYGGNDQPHFGKGAKPGVSIFADFSYNLKARQPDIYVKRGGTVTAANGYKLPAFRKVGFAVACFSLEGNAMTAPAWLANAAAMVYLAYGEGLECIAMIPKSRFQQGFLAGTNSVWRTLPASVQRAAFNADEKLLEKL